MSRFLSPFRALVLTVVLTAAVGASAAELPAAHGWAALERRISREQAGAILGPVVGPPLFVTRSRDGRFEVWNYDHGAYLLFVGGALDYWAKPKSVPPTPARAA